MLLSRSLKPAVLGCALLAPVLLGGCDRQSGEGAQPPLSGSAAGGDTEPSGTLDRSHKGNPLPDFTLKDGRGQAIHLPELAGKPVLMNLWATWCAPCIAELPMLDALAAKRVGDLKVLTVSQDMQTEKVAAFLKQRGGDHLEPWLDPDNDLSFHFGTGTLPTTVLYDAQGKEVWRYVGGHDWTSAETAGMLAEGLAR